MYRNLLGLLAVFAVALLLVGITFSSAAETRADYVFLNGTEPKTLDPQKMTGQPEGRIADAIFEGLTYRDNETLQPKGGMAASWTTSPDGKRWTFSMREGARWSNGDPVTAKDFVYAWKRLQESVTASEYAYLLHCIRHAEAYNTFASQVKALRGDPAGEGNRKRGITGLLRARLAKDGGSLKAKDWQAFVSNPFEEDPTEAPSVRDFTIRTPDPVLVVALAKDDGTVAAEEGNAIVAALESEAKRREEALGQAQKHFGVDEGVFAPDDKTFVVELNAFTPYFLELTAFYPTFPVHRATVEESPESWFLPGRIVTNGPFLLERWTVNQKIRMTKNPGYWGASAVSLKVVDALPIENRSTSLNLYLKGEADWLPSNYPVDLVDRLKKRPDFYGNPGMVVYYYKINTTRPPMTDPRVRRAIGLAFDRRMIVERITKAGQVPTTTFVAPGIPGYHPPESRLGYDVAEARKLLAEAGFPGGKGFPKIALLFNTDEGHRKIAEYVCDELHKNLGIDVNPVNQEWQSYLETVKRLDYDMSRAAWIGDYRDPNTFLDMWLTKGGNNQTGWGDPYYDRLIQIAGDSLTFADLPAPEREKVLSRFREKAKGEELLGAITAAKTPETRLAAAAEFRLQVFREAEAILVQDAFPIIPVYFYVVTGLVSPRVEGFYSELSDGHGGKVPNLQDLHPFRDVRMGSSDPAMR